MAFWERSGAPSRPPVHLHNVATCHMETGITNLCLSLVAPCPSSLTSQFCSSSLSPSFLLLLSFSLLILSCRVSWFVKKRLYFFIFFVNLEETRFHTQIKNNTHPCTSKASGVRWGSGGCMSTPAVRIAVTERRANTNVINTSALTPGTL